MCLCCNQTTSESFCSSRLPSTWSPCCLSSYLPCHRGTPHCRLFSCCGESGSIHKCLAITHTRALAHMPTICKCSPHTCALTISCVPPVCVLSHVIVYVFSCSTVSECVCLCVCNRVNLIMDTMGALALGTDNPHPSITFHHTYSWYIVWFILCRYRGTFY